jgi:hypothetical protein
MISPNKNKQTNLEHKGSHMSQNPIAQASCKVSYLVRQFNIEAPCCIIHHPSIPSNELKELALKVGISHNASAIDRNEATTDPGL